MNLRKSLLVGAALGMLLPLSAMSAPVAFDFTTLGANHTQLGSSVTVGPITAYSADDIFVISGGAFDGLLGGNYTNRLYLRNQTNDHGLGVCSGNAADGQVAASDDPCRVGGGDFNELDNIDSVEGIELRNSSSLVYTSLWVSSLDSGGTGGSEEGYLFWAYGSGYDYAGGKYFAFSYSSCNVECDILALAAASLSLANYQALIAAPYLLFTANFDQGNNNDFLVWKGTLDVPEPATLALLGLGLLGLGFARRKA